MADKKRRKIEKKIIPLAMAAVLTVQGTTVPVLGNVKDSLNSAYKITGRIVADASNIKELVLKANEKITIGADGYSVNGGNKESHNGSYSLTTNGSEVSDANIEIVGNVNITLKNCKLTTSKDKSGENNGLFSFSGGTVNLKLEGKNSISYTGVEDEYEVGNKEHTSNLTITGGGSLHLNNVSLGVGSLTIGANRVHIGKELKLDTSATLKIEGQGRVSVGKLDLAGGNKLLLNGDVVLYAKEDNGLYTLENNCKGVIYRGTEVTSSNGNDTFTGGAGWLYGDPDLSASIKPSGSQLLTALTQADVQASDVEYTGDDINPNLTVTANRKLTGNRTLSLGTDYTVEWQAGANKSSVGNKTITIKPIQNRGYIGDITANFDVNAKSIANAVIDLQVGDGFYNGKEQTVKINSVKVGGGKALTEDDYDIEAGTNNAAKAGSYKLKLQGKGNYTGEVTKDWEIKKAPLHIVNATIAEKKCDGKIDAKVLAVTFDGLQNGETLVKDTDYTVTGRFSDAKVGTGKTVEIKVTLNDNDKLKNYELKESTYKLINQEIKRGQHAKPQYIGEIGLDDSDPDNKFKYSVGIWNGAQYKMDDGNWQDSNVFTGIDPGSTHTFSIRVKASEGIDASEEVKGNAVKFDPIANKNSPVLKYKVENGTESGKKKITLTSEANVEYSFDDGENYFEVNVKDNIDSATTPVKVAVRFKQTKTQKPSSETKQEIDVSKNSYEGEAPELDGSYEVDSSHANKFVYKVKAKQNAPDGEAYQYSMDLSGWKEPAEANGFVTFDNIDPKSTHIFYASIKATGTHGEGMRGSKKVTFDLLAKTEKPDLNVSVSGEKGYKTVTITEVAGALYKFGDGSWQGQNKIENVADEKMTVGIRYAETTTHKASEAVYKEVTVNEKENNNSSGSGGSSGSTGSSGGTSSAGSSGYSQSNDYSNYVPYAPYAPLVSGSSETKSQENTTSAKQEDKKTEPAKEVKQEDSITKSEVSADTEVKPVVKKEAEAVSKTKAEANIGLEDISKAVEAADNNNETTVKLKVTAPKGTKAVDVKLENGILDSLVNSVIKTFEVTAAKLKLRFENKALASINDNSEGDVNLSISKVTKLDSRVKKIAGKRPVYKILLKSGDTKINVLDEGKVKISIPYSKPDGEKAKGLYVAYFNEQGKTVKIKASYDSKAKVLNFNTKHFTSYMVGYKAPKKAKK
ncbi:MAG: YDG domain-containing protein [Catonella sp.]|uniref:YDG domain-containing protein n=1 Tax=Catonella sp. TaxID=2382125 RepID=UPI003FA0127B